MKAKQLVGVFFGIFVFLFFSCATELQPPPLVISVVETRIPLTVSLVESLSTPGRMQEDIERLQLHLFGRITLERDYERSIENVHDGRATIVTERIREEVIINDQTLGQAIWTERTGEAIELWVSFDYGDDFLVFYAQADNRDGFFDLQFGSRDDLLNGDEGDWLRYGENWYRVRFTGDRPPHLLIQLSQEDRDRLNRRTLRGRRVN